MKDISMTLSSAEVQLVDGRGTLTASVTNRSSTAERIMLAVFPAHAPHLPGGPVDVGRSGPEGEISPGTGSAGTDPTTWARIEEPQRTIAPGALAQYEISFDMTGTPPGSYHVKLIPYSADEAPEDYAALGVIVRLTVPNVVDKKTEKEEKRKFPWWIVAATEALLLVAAGVWMFLATRESDVTISSYSPSSGPATGGTEVRLLGRFEEPTIISMGNTRVEATRVSDEEYSFLTPDAGRRSGQVPFGVESGGRRVGVIVFDYVAELIAPASPPLLSPPAISEAGYARVEWPAYTCPSSLPPLYEVLLDPTSGARLEGENPTRFTGGEIIPESTGSISVTYRVQCGAERSPFSPPGFLFVY